MQKFSETVSLGVSYFWPPATRISNDELFKRPITCRGREKGVLAQCHNKHLATRPGTASPTMAAPLSKRWHQPRPWEAPGFATLWKVEGGKKPQFMPGILGWQHSRAPYWSPSILPTKRWLERIRLLLSHRAFLILGILSQFVFPRFCGPSTFSLVHHHPGCTQKAIVQISFCCPCGLQPFLCIQNTGFSCKNLVASGRTRWLDWLSFAWRALSVVRILWPSRYAFAAAWFWIQRSQHRLHNKLAPHPIMMLRNLKKQLTFPEWISIPLFNCFIRQRGFPKLWFPSSLRTEAMWLFWCQF